MATYGNSRCSWALDLIAHLESNDGPTPSGGEGEEGGAASHDRQKLPINSFSRSTPAVPPITTLESDAATNVDVFSIPGLKSMRMSGRPMPHQASFLASTPSGGRRGRGRGRGISDGGDGNKTNSNNHFLFSSQRRKMLSQKKNCLPQVDTLEAAKNPPPPKPAPMPCTLALREWVAYHVKNRHANPQLLCKTARSWRGTQSSNEDNEYFEKCVQVALSLTTKLLGQQSVLVGDITMENIIVHDTSNGDSQFIKISSDIEESPNERLVICSLGKIFYEMFSRGSIPPKGGSNASSGRSTGSTAAVGMFGRALKIDAKDEDMKDAEDVNFEEEYRRERRRRIDQKEKGIAEILKDNKVPSSLCRLVADMMENEGYEDNMFCSDLAMSSLHDVLSDLTQMTNNPKGFLHESVIVKWKPDIAKNKLYCREKELQQAIEVVDRVSPHRRDSVEELTNISVPQYLKQQAALVISGDSGQGKTLFVQELSHHLVRSGWRCVECKFERVQSQPLYFIITAFNRYFANLITEANACEILHGNDVVNTPRSCCNDELKKIQQRILENFCSENLSILLSLIPNIKNLMSDEGDDTFHESHSQGQFFDTNDAIASQPRLHIIFGLLVKLMAETKPLALLLDDLYLADQASLDLMTALMKGIGEVIINPEDEIESSGILFVATFRTNEVLESDQLACSLSEVKSIGNVCYTDILLDGLTCDEVNMMVSEALYYPMRLSKPLSMLIHQKSTGNPLFVKELLNDLSSENLLTFSLSSRKWEWDEDVIAARTISDGVAELLTRRLLRLPEKALQVLRVLSIFGTSVEMEVLSHISDFCGTDRNIIDELSELIKESIIQIPDNTCQFNHDMIWQAVCASYSSEEKRSMMIEISDLLFLRTSEKRSDAILFILADLINKIGPEGQGQNNCVKYANLNLIAGEKALQIPNFESAKVHFESGITFLGEDCWSKEYYRLSLALFKNAAFSQYARGKTDMYKKRLNEVLDNASSFADKVESLTLMIQSLTMDGELALAFEKSLVVLEQLGETFPKSPPANDVIVRELRAAKDQLEAYEPSTISNSIPQMTDPQKMCAMAIFPSLLLQCYLMKSRFYPLVGCRMATLTMQYGLHHNSALGFSGLALAFATVLLDVGDAYRLGKYALAMTSNKNLAGVHCTMLGMISIWKEPVQVLLPGLINAHRIGMQNGRITEGLINSSLYSIRAFFSGSKLSSLEREVVIFIRQHSLYPRDVSKSQLLQICNGIMSFTGHKVRPYEDMEPILGKYLAKKDWVVCETIIVCKLMCSFIFRDLDTAGKIVHQYSSFFEQQSGILKLGFVSIYLYFYTGLVAFHCFRKTKDQVWMNIGEKSISKFEKWTAIGCEWNFVNKLLLLRAEKEYAMRNTMSARHLYDSAISSAHDHRFYHEEALSCELACIFYRETSKDDSEKRFNDLMKRASDRYEQWGATVKAKAIRSSLP